MMGFPPLGDGQEISADRIFPTWRTVSVHSAIRFPPFESVNADMPTGTLSAILRELKPFAMEFFPPESPTLLQEFFLSKPHLML